MRLELENRAGSYRGARRAGMAIIGPAVVLIGVLEIGCGGGGDLGSTRSGASLSLVEKRQQTMGKLANEATRASLMALLAYPQQAGPYIGPILLGRARLELYQPDDKDVYFYLSQADSSGDRLE